MAVKNKFNEDENLAASFNWSMVKRSFVYIKNEKLNFLKAIALQTAAILSALFVPVISAKAIDGAIPQKNIQMLLIYSALLVVCMVINIYFVTIASKVVNLIGQNIVFDLRRDLYEHMQKLSFSYYDSRPHGKILVRVINYVNSVSNILSNGLISMLLQVFNLVFIVAFMFAMDAKLSLIILSGAPVTIIFMLLIKPIQRKGWQEYSSKSSNMNAYLNESITCMNVTQLFTREKYNTDVYDDLMKEAKKKWYKAVFSSGSVGPVIDFISKAVCALLLYYGIFVANPVVSIGVLLAMMQYCSRFWQPINNIANIYNNFINNIAYLERIFETIDEPVAVHDKENATQMPSIKGDVKFENVLFEYDKGVPVLKNVSFDVTAGESVALVGHTGSGKTTIINLISRFYDCTSGKVLIDGQDISEVSLNSLRSQMGLMMQDSFIFSGTVFDNLRYGNLTATDDELIAAAKLVCADLFIQKLPKGYNTHLSEGGAMLSQGEKQLLALARTMASNPRILILDEATSSIDTKTERELQEGVNRMLKGRTSFIVAHRLSTIRACSKIMFINQGEIMEVGTHDQLMAKKGFYYNLCQNQ